MRLLTLLRVALAASALSSVAAAQVAGPRARILRPEIAGGGGGGYATVVTTDDEPYAAIGISTSMSASERDTLGLLVTAVTEGSPAERAGIEEGNRIVSINGTNLRLNPNDAGEPEMMGIMTRRLTRELRKAKPGDDVELRVYQSGRERTMRVRTAPSNEVFKNEIRSVTRKEYDERPSLGFGIGAT